MKVVYFDGVCNVCNRFVDFLIRRDRHGRLKYAPLQGSSARAQIPAEYVDEVSTIVMQDEQGRVFTKSSAAIRAIAALGGPYSLMWIFLLVPRSIRDFVYQWVADHRYLWFGKRNVCRLPTPAERERFLD